MTGAELRDKGLEAAGSGGPVAIQVSWEMQAKAIIRLLASCESDFTAEDVRKRVGDPPHPNCLGAVMRQAYKKGLIQPVGVVMAERPSRHASMLRTWRGR